MLSHRCGALNIVCIKEVNAQQVWGAAAADVVRNGTDPKVATEAAFKKVEAIIAKYPIVQS